MLFCEPTCESNNVYVKCTAIFSSFRSNLLKMSHIFILDNNVTATHIMHDHLVYYSLLCLNVNCFDFIFNLVKLTKPTGT